MSQTHKWMPEGDSDLLRERRLMRQRANAPEAPPEGPRQGTETRREPERPAVEGQRAGTRNRVQQTMEHGRAHSETSEIPPLQNFSPDPIIHGKQIEQARREFEESMERLAHQPVLMQEREKKQPLAKNALRTGLIAGSAAFVPSYLAYLGSGSALGALGVGGAGALLGKWIGGPDYPVKGPLIGAGMGMVGGPALGALLTKLGTHLGTGTLLASTGLLAVPGFVLGTYYAYRGMRKDYGVDAQGHHKWLRDPHSKLLSGVVAPAGGLLAAAATGGFGAATHALFLGEATKAIGAGVSWLGSTFPTYALSGLGLSQAGSLALIAGAAGAGLYGLGRLEGRLWGREKTGIWGNLLRGILSPATLSAYGIHRVAWKFPKYLLGKGKDFVVRNAQATKRIFTGNSVPVKAITSPIWWPLRSAYRLGRGVIKGVNNGLKNIPPSEKDLQQGVFAKAGRAVGLPVGKIAASPYRLVRYLFSPTWDFDKK